jgi:hypothetical protein
MAALGLAVLSERYTYAETNYAYPHALTGFFNGSATTTYAYDAIGNLATTTGASTSTFNWDYRNRMISAWVSGATTRYGYDETVQRVRQTSTTTTTHYPNKFYSVEYAGLSTTTGTQQARRRRSRQNGDSCAAHKFSPDGSGSEHSGCAFRSL